MRKVRLGERGREGDDDGKGVQKMGSCVKTQVTRIAWSCLAFSGMVVAGILTFMFAKSCSRFQR